MFENEQIRLKMLDISKTTDLVKKEIEHDLYLLSILKDGLVNISALSRQLLPAVKKNNPKATIESISMALKRYVEKEKQNDIASSSKKIISESQISSKNDVVHITFRRNNTVLKLVSEISQQIKWDDDEIFFINQGSGEVTIILDRKNEHLLKSLKRFQMECTSGLTIISIKDNILLKEKSIDYPGIYAHYTNELSRRSINLISLISTYTQITFAVKSEDFIRAYDTLQNCISYFRKD